jgi:concentrative nucleoside transporter, CNT family
MIVERLICVIGLVAFIFLAWVLSSDRGKFPWRVVCGGLALQIVLGFLILRTTPGRVAFDAAGSFFNRLMQFVGEGSGFLFRRGEDMSLIETFAFGVLPTVIFFSALMSVLYHLGIMQRIVWAMAWVMQFTLKTSGPETLAAAANVFRWSY